MGHRTLLETTILTARHARSRIAAAPVRRAACLAAAATCAIGSSTASAAGLETYVLAVAGQSGYPTYAVPAPVGTFFGPVGVGIPSNGLPAGGLGGVDRSQSGVAGVLTDAATGSGSGDSLFGLWSASGSSAANATFGKVGAQAGGTRVGIGDGNTVVSFEGIGKYTEHWTFNDPRLSGAVGTAVLHFRIDGTILSAGPSNTVGVAVDYQQNGNPVMTLMAANIQGTTPFFVPFAGAGHDGYAIGPTSIAGTGVFDTIPLDITFGSGFDFTLGLLAYASPRGGTASTVFASSALLVGIDVYDVLGRLVTDFSIAADSGTRYDANGVHFDAGPAAVPEPGADALIVAGMFAALACAFRRGRHVDEPIGGRVAPPSPAQPIVA